MFYYTLKYTGILMYWKSASKYSIQAVTISMYMLINSSKNPQNYQIDQNTVLCFHTLYSEKPADNLQCHKVSSFHNTKRIKWSYFVVIYGTSARSIRPPIFVKSLLLEKWLLQ